MKTSEFVVCISNEGFEASLELKKIYEVVMDSVASSHDQTRIIDESGEDYVYPSNFFVNIDLPASLRAQLSEVAQ
jgi:hypothetical protein